MPYSKYKGPVFFSYQFCAFFYFRTWTQYQPTPNCVCALCTVLPNTVPEPSPDRDIRWCWLCLLCPVFVYSVRAREFVSPISFYCSTHYFNAGRRFGRETHTHTHMYNYGMGGQMAHTSSTKNWLSAGGPCRRIVCHTTQESPKWIFRIIQPILFCLKRLLRGGFLAALCSSPCVHLKCILYIYLYISHRCAYIVSNSPPATGLDRDTKFLELTVFFNHGVGGRRPGWNFGAPLRQSFFCAAFFARIRCALFPSNYPTISIRAAAREWIWSGQFGWWRSFI